MKLPPNASEPDRQRMAVARRAVQRLQDAGHTAFWAGGCVRDMLMGRPPKDFDIATSAVPDVIMALFPSSLAVGKSFGVVLAPLEEFRFEIATFRTDHAYRDGRRPEGVTFSTPREDAQRRDFTINAMFYDPVQEALHDWVDGQEDIEARSIRFVGDASCRIEEDHLRMLRAVRFAATLGFQIDLAAEQAIRSHVGLLSRISAERIREELTRTLLEARAAGDALLLVDHLGLLDVLLPEVAAMKGEAQPPEFHPEGDVFEHTVLMLNKMEERSALLVYAVLLHDAGKVGTARHDADRIRFPCHAQQGSEIAANVLRRLRFPTSHVDTIKQVVRDHMRFIDVPRMKDSTLRKMVGAPAFSVELELHRLDCLASHGKLDNYRFLVEFRERLAHEPALPPSWITGHDIMQLGIPQGPEVGKWCQRAYDAQLEGQAGDREQLLAWLRERIRRS